MKSQPLTLNPPNFRKHLLLAPKTGMFQGFSVGFSEESRLHTTPSPTQTSDMRILVASLPTILGKGYYENDI